MRGLLLLLLTFAPLQAADPPLAAGARACKPAEFKRTLSGGSWSPEQKFEALQAAGGTWVGWSKNGRSLHPACAEVIDALLAAGVDINAPFPYGPIIFYAVLAGGPDAVRSFLEKGARVDVRRVPTGPGPNYLSDTLAHVAVNTGDLAVLDLLAKNGLDFYAVNSWGESAADAVRDMRTLRWLRGRAPALFEGKETLTRRLAHFTGPWPKDSPDRFKIMEFLLAAGADIRGRGKDGESMVSKPAHELDLEMLRFLKAKGAEMSDVPPAELEFLVDCAEGREEVSDSGEADCRRALALIRPGKRPKGG